MRRRPARRTAKDEPARREWIRSLPCFVCYKPLYLAAMERPEFADILSAAASETSRARQSSPTECAHIGESTSRRGLSQRFPDAEAAPLCAVEHHREGRYSIHKCAMGAQGFFQHHGIDRDRLLKLLQRMWEGGAADGK